MPWAPKKICGASGCQRLADGRYCPQHAAEAAARKVEQDRERGSSSKRGYGYRWQRERREYLRQHPLCECPDCQAGVVRVVAATVVDHIRPHRGDQRLMWDRDNWQALSAECHARKTAREDGGFGNPRRRGRGGVKTSR